MTSKVAVPRHKGEKLVTLSGIEIKPPPPMPAREVAALRARLRMSRAAFARILNVSPKVVESLRRPGGAALKLHSIARRHPEALLR